MMLRLLNISRILGQSLRSRGLVTQRQSNFGEEDFKIAREWLASFSAVPADIYEVSYSRACGPGGQNVNKVNSKATMKVDLDALLSRVPLVLHEGIRQSPYCTSRTNSLVLSSDDSRKQNENRLHCEAKLRHLIQDVGRQTVRGETSHETKQRVKHLKAAANEARLRSKKSQSSKKKSRGGSSSPYD